MRKRSLRQKQYAAAAVLMTLTMLGAPPAAPAAIFSVTSGFRQPELTLYGTGEPAVTDSGEFSYRGTLCPAPGTPNYLCGRIRGFSGIEGGRIVLRSLSRLKRTDADGTSNELAAYSDVRMQTGEISGYTTTAPGAVFYFGLHGTLVNTRSSTVVTTQAIAQAWLDASSREAVQCAGIACAPGEVAQARLDDWNVRQGFYLTLRTDVALGSLPGATGWSAEVAADFVDTLELLAIQLLDENDQPIPGVQLSFKNAAGEDVPIPDTPPAPPTPTVTPPPGATITPTPFPTATACAGGSCEDCDNCVDDDGDTLVDRADPDCPPPANGAGAGLAEPGAAKALDACAKIIRKGGRTLATARLKHVQACLTNVAECVQRKGGDGACLAKAQTACTKARDALPAVAQKVDAAIVKACGAPPVTAGDLTAAAGLGFAAEAAACARRGVAPLATVADVAACVTLQHACAVERLLGFVVPRAGELLTLGGWDAANALPCLGATSVGGSAGIGADKAKALRTCDLALRKAATKLTVGRLKAGHVCGTGAFTCLQTKPGDSGCFDKAATKCTKALAALPALTSAFTSTIAKACEAAPLEFADLQAAEGLGFATRDADCAARGIPTLATVAGLAQCLERELACRADQLLEHATPRLRELLQAAGPALP